VKNSERRRIKRIKLSQKTALTVNKVREVREQFQNDGAELGADVVSALSNRHLKNILLNPERFENLFAGYELPRLAKDELFDRGPGHFVQIRDDKNEIVATFGNEKEKAS
jgi:hypothetical protein